jgi:hypothetical protein
MERISMDFASLGPELEDATPMSMQVCSSLAHPSSMHNNCT